MVSQLERLVKKATQAARLRQDLPLVGFVSAGLETWVKNGLLEADSARAFYDALLEAGAELALAPSPSTKNRLADDRKRAALQGRAGKGGPDSGGTSCVAPGPPRVGPGRFASIEGPGDAKSAVMGRRGNQATRPQG